MVIIGITGTIGAGKGTAVKLLRHHGFQHYSVREFLKGKLEKMNIEPNRDQLLKLANSLREKGGPSAIVDAIYEEASKNTSDAIIESIRCPGEIDSLKKKGNIFILAIDADQKTRYGRISKRKSETDSVTFEEFKTQEEREFSNEEPFKNNLKKCIAMADYTLENSGSYEELKRQIEIFYNEYLKKR